MTFLQAIRYFLREAGTGLVRSLRVSLLAIFTIGVSLFLSGALFLFSQSLARTVGTWRAEARLVVYVARGTDDTARAALRERLAASPHTAAIRDVPPAEAADRFQRSFPSLAELVTGGGGALPYSFELVLAEHSDAATLRTWTEALRTDPAVEMLDADQDWIDQMETLLALVRGVGLALTAVLLAASIFTIASVVRLTSFLYRDEIAVMRLVGATEFYIRGPFYVEGILQGFLGGGLAALALFGLDRYLHRMVASSAFAALLPERLLSPSEVAWLLLFGALAGWLGAVVSLGRESLQPASN